MKIIDIFAIVEEELFSVQYSNEAKDEFSKLFEQWQDPEYLERFFTENISDLNEAYHKGITIEEAIVKTIEEAQKLEEKILFIAENTDRHNYTHYLQEFFTPLDDLESNLYEYQPSKASYKENHWSKRGWLRLYAIRIDEFTYVVASGAIKLVEKIKYSEHLKREERKLDFVKDYLIELGFSGDGDYVILES